MRGRIVNPFLFFAETKQPKKKMQFWHWINNVIIDRALTGAAITITFHFSIGGVYYVYFYFLRFVH